MQLRRVVSREEAIAGFLHALEQTGMRAAMDCLRRATGYRCIGIFRVEGGQVQAVEVLQRECQVASEFGAWPEEVERKCYLRDDQGQLVQVGDSGADDGTQAGCRAVPIMDSAGEILGTLCLYDPWASGDAPIELELLLVAAAALAGHDPLRSRPQRGIHRSRGLPARGTAGPPRRPPTPRPPPAGSRRPRPAAPALADRRWEAVGPEAAAPRSAVEGHPAAAVPAAPERDPALVVRGSAHDTSPSTDEQMSQG